MLRSALLTATLALGLGAFAQAQLVNYGGYLTTAPVEVAAQNPSAVNAQGAPSVPAINPPVVHVGPQAGIANQPGEPAAATQANSGVATAPPQVVQGQTPPTNPVVVEVAPNQTAPRTFDLGAATVATNPFLAPGSGTDGQSLGQVAREIKRKDQNLNAKTYTNADIDRLNQATGANNGVMTANANSNYPANNGVITPPPANQNSIAAPAQNQSTTGNGPFSPRPQAAPNAPAERNNNVPNTPVPQPPPPQANAKPSAERPYEMAANHPGSAGIPQAGNDQNTTGQTTANQNTQAANDTNPHGRTLPKTASRLPLIGVLGFFSISMGLFVRYQRGKTSK
jgi:hypothetical protein